MVNAKIIREGDQQRARQSDRDDTRRIRIVGPLLFLPTVLCLFSAFLRATHGPYRWGISLEDYPYLFNALNILTFHVPGHMDHPGTTLQLFGAVVVLSKWLLSLPFGLHLSLPVAVVSDPEAYLRAIDVALNLATAGAMYFGASTVLKESGSWLTALAVQITPFLFFQVLLTQTRVQNEPLLTACGLALLVPLAPLVFRDAAENRRNDKWLPVGAGIIFGFAIVAKVTFLPLGLIIFLFRGRVARLRFAVSSVVASLFFLIPVISQVPYMAHWFTGLLVHADRYGQGRVGLPNSEAFESNFISLYSVEPAAFWFLIFYAAAWVVIGLAERKKCEEPQIVRLLGVGCVSLALQVAITMKHPAAHYLVGGLAITPLLNGAIVWYLLRSSLPRVVRMGAVAAAVVLASASFGHVAHFLTTWIETSTAMRNEIVKLEDKIGQERGCIIIGAYRTSLAGFALAFGDQYSNYRQRKVLAGVYPDVVSLNIWRGLTSTFAGDLSGGGVKSWLSEGQCVLLAGTPAFVVPQAPTALPGIRLIPFLAASEEAIYRLELAASPADGDHAPAAAVVGEGAHAGSLPR